MENLRFNNQGQVVLSKDKLPENCLIVISKGKIKVQRLPDFGSIEIKTHQGMIKQLANTENSQF